MSKFMEDLMKNNFYEKTASDSSKDDIKRTLGALSDDAIEALAEELSLFEKVAETTVEEKATEKALKQEAVSEKNVKGEQNDPDKTKDEDAATAKAKAEGESKQTKEDDKTEAAKEEVETQKEKKDDADVAIGNKTADEKLEDYIKLASDLESDIEKDAYEMVGDMLKEAGYSTADYVFNLLGDESIAIEISEAAEKLAEESEQPVIKVARDLALEIIKIASSDQE